MSDSPHATVPPWRTARDAVVLIVQGVTYRTASRVALVVGTILSAVNQGTLIANGNAVATTWVRVAINYAVPYTVASIGYLSPFRVAKSQETAERGDAADY